MSQHELSEEQARGIAAKVYEDDPAFPFHALPKPSQVNLVRYVRAGYAAANLAEAERKGAFDAFTRLAHIQTEQWDKVWLLAQAAKYAPAPEGVTLTCALCGGDITGEDDVFLRHKADGAADAHLDRDACIASLAARLAKVGAA